MNKRGSHVDWVISIGIFIIFTLMILGFFRPSYKASFEGGILLDIVQTGLENSDENGYSWEVRKVPIFIRGADCNFRKNLRNENMPVQGPGSYKEGNVKIVDFFRDFNVNDFFVYKTSEISRNEYQMIENGVSKPGFRKAGSDLEVEISPDTSLKPGGSFWNYWVFFSGDSYPDINGLNENWELVCNPKPNHGEALVFKGIKKEKIASIKDAGYDNFKVDWNYPELREFKIVIFKLTETGYVKDREYGYAGEPYEGAEVFVREWKYNMLDKYGNKEEIIVSMRAW